MDRSVAAGLLALIAASLGSSNCAVAEAVEVPRFHVYELTFKGPQVKSTDMPERDIDLMVTFEHGETRTPQVVGGFWDGDGQGGAEGNVFRVRFCPTLTGDWTVKKVDTNREELRNQHVGDLIRCTQSRHPGLWIADGRWYRRSDGTHPFLIGNTHYSFVSRQNDQGPVATKPDEDIRREAKFYKKVRFSLVGCRYPDPDVKPFLDEGGHGTDDGHFSHRPNPRWFHERVDPVVRAGFDVDVICDLILCGPDTADARSTLRVHPDVWMKYVAARYGPYPNVWFCLCNEWNIKKPHYTAAEIRGAGDALRGRLPHASTPVSVHSNTGNWTTDLNGDWHDHAIIQWKLKTIDKAADAAARNFTLAGGKPVVNDENAYQGNGDKFTEEDVIEGCLGTFLGGGYPTTGEKYANKLGQYFWGGFDAGRHTASDNLGLLRDYVDQHVRFWELAPANLFDSPFSGAPEGFRLLRGGDEYVLGSNRPATLSVPLPEGTWRIEQVDLIGLTSTVLETSRQGPLLLSTPASRAALTHFRKVD